MNYERKKIEALNRITKSVDNELELSTIFSDDPKVIASTLLRNVRHNELQKEIQTLIETIIEEYNEPKG